MLRARLTTIEKTTLDTLKNTSGAIGSQSRYRSGFQGMTTSLVAIGK